MSYFVTGATGFIGRYLVGNLLKRSGTVYVLVRKDSQKKFDAIAKKAGWDMKRVSVVHGDMTKPRCGLTPAQLRTLTGKVKHFFHLAAIYDLTATRESQQAANIDGTQHALDLAERMDEVYNGHAPSISPKLSRLPSQIVRDQVHCALQNDTGSIATRRGVGIEALLFASDYPHSEGTFPFTRNVVDKMMAEHPDASMDDFVAVLGGNAAKLFSRANLQPQVDARRQELAIAA